MGTIGADMSKISRNTEMAQFIVANPLGFPYGPRARTGFEVVRSAERVQREMGRLSEAGLALFVRHGEDDATTQHKMSAQMVEAVRVRGSVECAHKTVPKGLHSLELD